MANMVVRTNVFALNAHRNMKNVGIDQQRSSQRLSSGYRINSAADDAAGLAISEGMRAQIRGLDQASRNTQDGQSMIRTTEGGLEEVSNILQRVRELLVQSSNDTNTQGQRDMIEQELNQLAQEIGSMQNRVEFNTSRVLAMGPAINPSVTDGISELVQDGNRVSDSFALIDANRNAVNNARELLATLDTTMRFDDMNSRQQATILRAFEAVLFSDMDTFGPNFVETNLPRDIAGRSEVMLAAEATISELTRLVAAEGAASIAANASLTLTTGNAAIEAVNALLNSHGAEDDSAVAVRAGLNNELRVSLGLGGAATAGDVVLALASRSNVVINDLLSSISFNYGTHPGNNYTFSDSAIANVISAVNDYQESVALRETHQRAVTALFNAGFGGAAATAPQIPGEMTFAQGPTNAADFLTGAQSASAAVQAALNLYSSAANTPGTSGTTVNDNRTDVIALLDRLAGGWYDTGYAAAVSVPGRGLDVGGPSVSQLTALLSTRTTDLLDRSGTLDQVRFDMMNAAEGQFGTVRDFASATTSGNYVAWYQVGANANQGTMFDFETVSRTVSAAAAVVDIVVALAALPDSGAGVGRGIDISPLINEVQSSLDDIARVRANLGAVDNRLGFTMSSLDISSENLSDAESRIRNTDIAREMMAFTMANVLQQASVSMLAQANQMPNNLLQLLR